MQYHAAPELSVWRDGPTLVVRKETVLPPRCVKCNAPAEGRPIRKMYYWHQPLLYLLIFAGVLIYAIVALIVRESGVVHVNLCPKHRSQRVWSMLAAWLLVPTGLVCLIAGAANESGLIAISGLIALIGGIVFAFLAQLLRPSKIDRFYVWLKGVHNDYLAQFPAITR